MNNKSVIEQINNFVSSVEKQNPARRDIVEFNLQDVQISDAFILNDMDFSVNATDAILGLLNTKPSFKQFQSLMEPQDWASVSQRLKTAVGDINLFGAVIQNKDNSHTVDSIFFKNVKKKKPDDLTNAKAIIETINETLSMSDVDWQLTDILFDKDTAKFAISLLNDNNPFDVMTGDIWKQGQTLSFNSTSFKNEPFFERLVCGNGMRRPQYGWSSNVSKISYNNDKLAKVINNALSKDNPEVAQLITQFAQHMKSANISLREFYFYRKFFEKKGYEGILDKYYIEAPFYKAWGDNVAEKSDIWKATADSGINAYDFINLNTWLASHIEKSDLSKEDAADLKVHITTLFTAKELDMERIAPSAQIIFPRFVEME